MSQSTFAIAAFVLAYLTLMLAFLGTMNIGIYHDSAETLGRRKRWIGIAAATAAVIGGGGLYSLSIAFTVAGA